MKPTAIHVASNVTGVGLSIGAEKVKVDLSKWMNGFNRAEDVTIRSN